MSVTNALLIRAAYGWDGADDSDSQSTYGRREALYGLGSYNSPADVARTAAARFAISASPRYQFDAIHSPANDEQVAYHGYAVGDRLPVTSPAPGGTTEERVVSFSVSENRDDGRALVTTTLNDVVLYASPVENFLALISNVVKKMINGTGRGAWAETQPVTPPAQIVNAAPSVPTDPCCGFTIPVENASSDAGRDMLAESNGSVDDFASFNGFRFDGVGLGSCTVDMTMEWTVVQHTAVVGSDSGWGMNIRMQGSTVSTAPFYWHLEENDVGDGATATYELFRDNTSIAGPVTAALPQPGERWLFSAIGDQFVVTRDGVVLLSATDATAVPSFDTAIGLLSLASPGIVAASFTTPVALELTNVTLTSWCR